MRTCRTCGTLRTCFALYALFALRSLVGQLVALTAGKLLEEDVSDEVCERLYEEMMAQAGERE